MRTRLLICYELAKVSYRHTSVGKKKKISCPMEIKKKNLYVRHRHKRTAKKQVGATQSKYSQQQRVARAKSIIGQRDAGARSGVRGAQAKQSTQKRKHSTPRAQACCTRSTQWRHLLRPTGAHPLEKTQLIQHDNVDVVHSDALLLVRVIGACHACRRCGRDEVVASFAGRCGR